MHTHVASILQRTIMEMQLLTAIIRTVIHWDEGTLLASTRLENQPTATGSHT